MGSFSFVHWFIMLFMLAIFVVPTAMIVRKAGYSGWWCLLGFVPIVNIVMLWVFAFSEWPSLRQSQAYAADRRGY
jgi:uncharacterized membrane protein YhaH (DUF805 family)